MIYKKIREFNFLDKTIIVLFLGISFYVFSCSVSQKIFKPGKISNNKILLPNGWSLSPAGESISVGDLPLNMAINPDETFAVVTNNGYSKPTLSIIDLKNTKIVQTVDMKNIWLGIKFYENGKKLAVSGGNENKIYLFNFDNNRIQISDSIVLGKPYPKDKISITGLDIDEQSNLLCLVTKENNSFYAINLSTKEINKKIDIKGEGYACKISSKNPFIYVSVWGSEKVLVLNKYSFEIVSEIKVESHPNDVLEDMEGKRLFVANANENTVSVIDIAQNKVIETIVCSLYPNSPSGSTPNSLDLSGDGKVLFVANADNNCIALIDVSEYKNSKSLGFIPTGWYPTCVKYTKDKILVLNGKGSLGSRENIDGPQPMKKNRENKPIEYIAGLFKGSLSFINHPDKEKLKFYSGLVFSNSPYKNNDYEVETPNPIPYNGSKSPIKYVFYVIKENRTYDQVFGDIKEGNGDSSLCLFSEKISPNHHKLAKEFILFDNFYVDAEVSADGHNWSMAAYATDYVEKTWPTLYSGRGGTYDYEGGKKICSPAKGYIWDYCKRYNISYRVYGEFVENIVMRDDSVKPVVDALIDHIDPLYKGFDLKYKDIDRMNEWIREFNEFEKNNNLPSFQVIRLGNDHTAGTAKGMRTPYAMFADNDLALGMLVERISKSKFWKESAIFILEDDAQNGADHVDAHRSPVLIVSPYIKRGIVDSRLYTTSSVLRTMELLLGLPPMSQYDAAARPFYAAFCMAPDFKSYDKVIPDYNLEEMNIASAYGQEICSNLDLSEADRIPDLLFSEILWKSLKGTDMPSLRRSVFLKY